MNDEQLLRYSRQIMLPQIDVTGQERLGNSTALIIGMGGLGSPIALYLAAAGVGHLILVDDDRVELSNLQRQIIHGTAAIGQPKVESACQRLQDINPDVQLTLINKRLSADELQHYAGMADVVLDGSDNFATRFAVNAACVVTRTPLVSGAAIRFEGQVSVFLNRDETDPCYQCLYKEEGEENLNCTENGVLAPVVGVIGSVQAVEAIKVLLGIGEVLTAKLLLLDALHMEWRCLRLKKDPHCSVCQHMA